MKRLNYSKQGIATLLAFALIPLSGLALDIYIPSLPDMARQLHTTPGSIQLTLSVFMISYGIAQLFVGALLDSYGRYLPTLVSLLLFSLVSFALAQSTSINMIYVYRAIQGITVAIIVVSKRVYFVDLFSGDKLKNYTSLFSVIWSAAPIVAPFVGGYLQATWGWQSNFYFLAFFAILLFILELIYSGETIKIFQPFHVRSLVRIYRDMITTKDFTSGTLILGFCFSMLLIYGMASPFLIEHQLHYTATMTGKCSLISGISVCAGGLISKSLIRKPFVSKLMISVILQIAGAVVLGLLTLQVSSLYTLLAYVIIIHIISAFIFNNLLSYSLMIFPQNAGKATGLVGGAFSIFSAIFSYVMVGLLNIKSQPMLAVGYVIPAVGILILLLITPWNKKF